MNDKFKRNTIILTVIAAVLLVVPALLMNGRKAVINAYTAQILTLGGINAIMALSVNVVCGITGQLSLGQAAFQSLGANSTIVFTQTVGIPLPVSIILG